MQTKRLDRAQDDLRAARAALYVPDAEARPTKETWQAAALAAQRDLGTCRENTAGLQAIIQAANAEVDRLGREGQAATAAAERLAAELKDASRAAGSRATAILNAQAGADRCTSALDLIRGGGR